MPRTFSRVRVAALTLSSGALLACALAAPAGAAAPAPVQGEVRPGSPGISVTMRITPPTETFPDGATIDMVATYGYRTWQPRTAATCPGASPFTGLVGSSPRPAASWCIYTTSDAPSYAVWTPKAVATFPYAGRTYLIVNDILGYAQVTLTRRPAGGQPAKVADIYLGHENGWPIVNHGGGIAVAGTKLYLADGKNLRVFDLMKIGANRDSYGLLQQRVYTSTSNLFTSLYYDAARRQLVATSYGVDATADRAITFWSVASNGYLTAPTPTIRPVRTMVTRTTEITGIWTSGSTYVLSTAQTSTGRLYVDDTADGRPPVAYSWVDEPAGLAQWKDGYLVAMTQPNWRDAAHTSRTEATLFVFAEPSAR